MPVRATVEALAEPGHAILRVSELDAAPDGLALSIQRQQGPDSHLADDGWRRTEAWLLPGRVERRRNALEFHLGPEICDRLAGIATVRVRVKEPDIGVVGTTVVAWPAMLTSGAVDPSSRLQDETVRLRRAPPKAAPAPPPEPPPEPAPEPPAPPFTPPPPRPELRASRALDRGPPEPSSRAGWLVAALILVAIAGGGYHVYTTYFQTPQPVVATAPPTPAPAPAPVPAASAPGKSVRDIVGEYLATRPTPEAMLAKARDYAKAGEMGAAFLVFRRAAETGNAPAQIELAAFYDPLSTPAKAGFTPDAARAAEWYERAALAGSAEAQRKLGLLLAKGGANLPVDAAKAKSWLQQAAAQNDTDAKKVLDALPK
jgi:Sel1 repeat-containing protein